jgi:hypothetical protein
MWDFLENDEATGRAYVAGRRVAAAARGHDEVVRQLINDLSARSAEFATYWETMEVQPNRSTAKTRHHPQAGTLDVHRDIVLSATSGHRLVVLRPQPGPKTAERFQSLPA